MLSFSPGIQVFMAVEPVDMRKSFDGLSAAVETVFERGVLDGHLFLFLNRRRDRIKIIWWDRDGAAIWAKRLERGNYEADLAGVQSQSGDESLSSPRAAFEKRERIHHNLALIGRVTTGKTRLKECLSLLPAFQRFQITPVPQNLAGAALFLMRFLGTFIGQPVALAAAEILRSRRQLQFADTPITGHVTIAKLPRFSALAIPRTSLTCLTPITATMNLASGSRP